LLAKVYPIIKAFIYPKLNAREGSQKQTKNENKNKNKTKQGHVCPKPSFVQG
jgi:hypothetical protein